MNREKYLQTSYMEKTNIWVKVNSFKNIVILLGEPFTNWGLAMKSMGNHKYYGKSKPTFQNTTIKKTSHIPPTKYSLLGKDLQPCT